MNLHCLFIFTTVNIVLCTLFDSIHEFSCLIKIYNYNPYVLFPCIDVYVTLKKLGFLFYTYRVKLLNPFYPLIVLSGVFFLFQNILDSFFDLVQFIGMCFTYGGVSLHKYPVKMVFLFFLCNKFLMWSKRLKLVEISLKLSSFFLLLVKGIIKYSHYIGVIFLVCFYMFFSFNIRSE